MGEVKPTSTSTGNSNKRSMVRSFLSVVCVGLVLVLAVSVSLGAAYPSPDELYNGAKVYGVEHTDPSVPIVWVFSGDGYVWSRYFGDGSVAFVIQRGDRLVGQGVVSQPNYVRQTDFEPDLKKRLETMRDYPEPSGCHIIHSSYDSGVNDFYEFFLPGLGGSFDIDQVKIVYLDPSTSVDTFELPVKQNPSFPVVCDPIITPGREVAIGPVEGVGVTFASLKQYFGVDPSRPWNSHRDRYGDVMFIRRGQRVVGVEIIPYSEVRPGGVGFADFDARNYMRARAFALMQKSLMEDRNEAGLRFVLNPRGHVLIYNPSFGGNMSETTPVRLTVLNREFAYG
jgi:hypothetical protein